MTTFYFDTSAIVKRYHREVGSYILDKIFERREHAFATSFWTILEFVVAFSARMRRRELSREAFNIVISRFLRDVLDRFTITSVNDELVASAAPLAVEHALLSADCLQLASILHLKGALEPREEKPLVCSDEDLGRATQREGIEFVNPEEKNALEKLSKALG